MENPFTDDRLAMVAHDLKNPLQCIAGYANLMLRRMLSEQERDRALQGIISSSRWAAQIVEDLNDLASLDRGGLALDDKPFRLDLVIQEVVESFGITAADKEVSLVYEPLCSCMLVQGDPQRLRRVLDNLLANALKHVRPKSGSILVSAGRRAGRAWVEVSDNGCGIDPSDQPFLFDKFFQGSRERRDGLGLGLFIAKTILQAHGGDIAVCSAGLDKGTSFELHIPSPDSLLEDFGARVEPPPFGLSSALPAPAGGGGEMSS
ncbi:MAG TPA: hypothetical protein DD417_10845 [Elusimicrobia bacterium]|nr:hypothetical protein [Elusimicrobiota bacterium]